MRALLALASLACLALPRSGRAQSSPVHRIPDAVSCTSCRIDLPLRLTISGESGPGAILEQPLFVQTRADSTVLVGSREGSLRLYSKTGRYLRRIGTRGDGPGEYRSPSLALRLPGDSTLVLDDQTRRATVLDGTLTARRSISLGATPVSRGSVRAWPQEVWLSDGRSYQGEARPVHTASFAGPQLQLTRTFTAVRDAAPPGMHPEGPNPMIVGTGGRVWSVNPRDYALRAWRAPGSLELSLARDARWFDGPSPTLLGGPSVPPRTRIRDLWTDQRGYVWVLVWLAAPTWREAWPTMPRGGGQMLVSAIDFTKLYRSRIEVIDPTARAVISRVDVPQLLLSFTADGAVAAFEEDAFGGTSLRLLQPWLVGR